MEIKNAAGEVKSQMVVLKTYFGLKEGQSLQDFNEEVKRLSPESKEELAIGAARELGYTIS